MSYSFSIRAASKDEAKAKLTAELDKVVEQQPVHGADTATHLAAGEALIDLLRTDEDQDITLTMSGSCWSVEDGLNSATLNVSVQLATKTTTA